MTISISSFFCFSVNWNVFLTGNAHPFSSKYDSALTSKKLFHPTPLMKMKLPCCQMILRVIFSFCQHMIALPYWPEILFPFWYAGQRVNVLQGILLFSNEWQQPISGQSLLLFYQEQHQSGKANLTNLAHIDILPLKYTFLTKTPSFFIHLNI